MGPLIGNVQNVIFPGSPFGKLKCGSQKKKKKSCVLKSFIFLSGTGNEAKVNKHLKNIRIN